MKEGDIIEWKGVNRTERGIVAVDPDGDFFCRREDGKAFSLNDLRYARSAKLIEK